MNAETYDNGEGGDDKALLDNPFYRTRALQIMFLDKENLEKLENALPWGYLFDDPIQRRVTIKAKTAKRAKVLSDILTKYLNPRVEGLALVDSYDSDVFFTTIKLDENMTKEQAQKVTDELEKVLIEHSEEIMTPVGRLLHFVLESFKRVTS